MTYATPIQERKIEEWTIEEVSQFIKSADPKLEAYAILFKQHVSLSLLNYFTKIMR